MYNRKTTDLSANKKYKNSVKQYEMKNTERTIFNVSKNVSQSGLKLFEPKIMKGDE